MTESAITDPATDCMVRVEHLEAALGDIASAAIILREYAQAPGGISRRDVVNAAVHLRGELEAMGFLPFVKTSGGKGVHIVVPTTVKLTWRQAHAACATIAVALAKTGRDTFTTTMGEQNRKGRIFIDYHRNARSATAVAAYSLRARPHLPASTPIDWRDLESIDSPEDLNYSTLPGLLTMAGDPWADINESARDLAP